MIESEIDRDSFFYRRIITAGLFFIFFALSGVAQEQVRIWKGLRRNAGSVELIPFLPSGCQQPTPAVIICPGGSYFWLSKKREGTDVARWLQSKGIAAFVLYYRVAGLGSFITHSRLVMRGTRFPDMMQDLQRSIQIIRENAPRYHVAPDKLGVMGFSAGGHLALMSGEYSETNYLEDYGIYPHVSLKPNFIAAIYPVVTMTDKRYVHRRSRRALLGEWEEADRVMKDSLSMEKHVRKDDPPVFLMNCKDDPVVRYQNSVMMDFALTENGIPHRYIQYATGGHGFGIDAQKTSKESIQWKDEFIKWILNLIK